MPQLPGLNITYNPDSPEDRYSKYKNQLNGLSSGNFHKFPSDSPKYKMILIGRDYKIRAGSGTILTNTSLAEGVATVGYTLPIPQMRLVDKYQIQYDDNFSFLGGLLQKAQRAAQAAVGLSLNKQKSVLMEAPALKRHEFTWKLSPKSIQESRDIRNIVNSLKRHMAPRIAENTLNLIMTFPLIFDIFFDPNYYQMYGFKPCVIESIEVDYSGGNQQPSLYNSGYPESILLSLTLLEIEFWVENDYITWNEGSDQISQLRPVSATGAALLNAAQDGLDAFDNIVNNWFSDR